MLLPTMLLMSLAMLVLLCVRALPLLMWLGAAPLPLGFPRGTPPAALVTLAGTALFPALAATEPLTRCLTLCTRCRR